MPLADALRIFRWRDDLQFDVPDEKTERPRQFFRLQNQTQSSSIADVASYATADPEGAYSWMATVCPCADATKCTVSVVVFFNRSLTSDRELSCGLWALGGSDFWLYVPASPPAGYNSAAVREKLMALKPGDWVLLRGRTAGRALGFKWYRVGALGDFGDQTGGQTPERQCDDHLQRGPAGDIGRPRLGRAIPPGQRRHDRGRPVRQRGGRVYGDGGSGKMRNDE